MKICWRHGNYFVWHRDINYFLVFGTFYILAMQKKYLVEGYLTPAQVGVW